MENLIDKDKTIAKLEKLSVVANELGISFSVYNGNLVISDNEFPEKNIIMTEAENNYEMSEFPPYTKYKLEFFDKIVPILNVGK